MRRLTASFGLRTALAAACAGLVGMLVALSQPDARVPPSSGEAKQLNENAFVFERARAYFASDDTTPPKKRLFRLTRDQIDITARGLLPGHVARPLKSVMARDPLQTNYEFAEMLAINSANHGALSGWVGGIAASVRKKPEVVSPCAQASDETCLATAARTFVRKALRGDVGADRMQRFVKFFVDGAKSSGVGQAAGDLVEVVLNSPDFLFRKEVDTDATTGTLLPAQRLQALSYMLADAPPDLLGLGTETPEAHVFTAEQKKATVERLLASKEAREKLVRFFKAWLEIREPDEFTISTVEHPEFTKELAQAMTQEADRFLRVELSKPKPRLSDITQPSEAKGAKALETVFKVSVAAGGAKPASDVAGERLGIFSQPAVLASHSGPVGTRPVKRGVFFVRKVMCMELGTPDPALAKTDYKGTFTTERNRIETLTAKKACIGCHKVIDPFGFFQESYDALGRWRTQDNGHPIDTSIAIDFLDEEPRTTAGPAAAIKQLTSSVKFKQCFARQLFRYYMGRQEEPGDEPLLRRMLFELAGREEQDLLGVIRLMALDERLLKRQ